jgi:hypothetical protein
MATLTETAYHARRAINWAILGAIAYIILRIIWSVLVVVYLAIFPPKPPPPTHAFGKLPAIKFPPPAASPPSALTFRLETIEGAVPPASDSAAVYFMPKAAANLLAITRAQDLATRLNLSPNPIQETKNIYRFEDPELPLRRMRYDIVSNNFILRYAFEQDAGLFSQRNLPLPQAAIAEARSMLQTFDLYKEDLAEGTAKESFLKLSGAQFIPTTSLSVADALRISFFRAPINGMPLVSANPDEGPIVFIFSGSDISKKRILQFAYTYWPVDLTNFASYSLKPTSQAWEELQGGAGFIARYPTNSTQAVVRTVALAYFDSYDPQTYLQPIFIFEGDAGFMAYVPAVASEWTE